MNTLNVGPDGSTITSAGSAGGGNAFSAVTTEHGATLQYDNARVRGSFSARHSLPSGGNSYYAWNGSFRNWYGRIYVWLDARPSGDLRLVRAVSGSSTLCAIDILADGSLRAVDSANNTIASIGGRGIRTGRWVRIEWHVDHQAGLIEIRLFNRTDSNRPTATAISTSGHSIGSSSSQVQFGRSGTEPTAITFWTDDAAISSNGFIGPS